MDARNQLCSLSFRSRPARGHACYRCPSAKSCGLRRFFDLRAWPKRQGRMGATARPGRGCRVATPRVLQQPGPLAPARVPAQKSARPRVLACRAAQPRAGQQAQGYGPRTFPPADCPMKHTAEKKPATWAKADLACLETLKRLTRACCWPPLNGELDPPDTRLSGHQQGLQRPGRCGPHRRGPARRTLRTGGGAGPTRPCGPMDDLASEVATRDPSAARARSQAGKLWRSRRPSREQQLPSGPIPQLRPRSLSVGFPARITPRVLVAAHGRPWAWPVSRAGTKFKFLRWRGWPPGASETGGNRPQRAKPNEQGAPGHRQPAVQRSAPGRGTRPGPARDPPKLPPRIYYPAEMTERGANRPQSPCLRRRPATSAERAWTLLKNKPRKPRNVILRKATNGNPRSLTAGRPQGRSSRRNGPCLRGTSRKRRPAAR